MNTSRSHCTPTQRIDSIRTSSTASSAATPVRSAPAATSSSRRPSRPRCRRLLDLVFRLKTKGFTPLIAHPERCLEFREHPERARQAVEGGAALQMELGALTNRYGPEARRLAERILDDGLYAVAATDMHGPVGAERWVPAAIEELEHRVGARGTSAMLRDNPGHVLRGEPLPADLLGGAA